MISSTLAIELCLMALLVSAPGQDGSARTDSRPADEHGQETPPDDAPPDDEEGLSATALKARKEFATAARRFRAGKIEEARRGFAHCLELDPGYASAAKMLGTCQLKSEEYDAAARTLLHALNLEPTSEEIPWLLVRVHRLREHFGLAEAFLKQIEGKSGWTPRLAQEQVVLARARGDDEATVKALEGWARAASEDPRPLRALLEESRKKKDWDTAVAVARRLVELGPENPSSSLQLVYVLRDAHRGKEAAELLEKLVADDPDDLVLRQMIVQLYRLQAPDPERARAHQDVYDRLKKARRDPPPTRRRSRR